LSLGYLRDTGDRLAGIFGKVSCTDRGSFMAIRWDRGVWISMGVEARRVERGGRGDNRSNDDDGLREGEGFVRRMWAEGSSGRVRREQNPQFHPRIEPPVPAQNRIVYRGREDV